MVKLDGISLAVIINNLQWATEEMNEYMAKSAFSSNIKIRRDCSCALYNNRGDMLAQGAFIPVHLGVMAQTLKALLEKFPLNSWNEGDAVIHNDPYTMGSHLSDVLVFKPIFSCGLLIGFAGTCAHQVDCGGSPVKYVNPTVFEEGIRITGVKFVRQGEVQRDILEFILGNVRTPYEVRGDIMSQLAACNRGEARMQALAIKYGAQEFIDFCEGILDYSEAGMRASIRNLPNGEYKFEDYLENDGIKMSSIKFKAKVIIKDEDVYIDFAGSDPPSAGGFNLPWSLTNSASYYAIKAVAGSNVPANAGAYRAIHLIRPSGDNITDTQFPHAVDACTSIPPQRVVDTIIGALAKLAPERCCACDGQWCALSFVGKNDRTGRFFSYIETYGAGRGAKYNEDGASAHQTHMTNTANAPVEIIEMEHPFLIKEYSLVNDSGGAGKFRGGLGISRTLLCQTKMFNSPLVDRSVNKPYGLYGGLGGGNDSVTIITAQGELLPYKTREIPAGTTVCLKTSGGGGWGDPHERSRERVEWDVLNGYVSKECAEKIYGVKIEDK